jgi:hypothetical protein
MFTRERFGLRAEALWNADCRKRHRTVPIVYQPKTIRLPSFCLVFILFAWLLCRFFALFAWQLFWALLSLEEPCFLNYACFTLSYMQNTFHAENLVVWLKKRIFADERKKRLLWNYQKSYIR